MDNGDVVICNEDTRSFLLAPLTKWVQYGYYNVVIGQNAELDIGNIDPKYYINFAKVSQGDHMSHFTFYTKNGRINLSYAR